MPLSPVLEKACDYAAPILTGVYLPALDGSDKKIPLITKDEFNDLKAISGYCDREGFFGAIATAIHRIWNAFLAIFGQSAWQRAERTIESMQARHLPYAESFIPIMEQMFPDPERVGPITVSPMSKERINEALQSTVEWLNEGNTKLKPVEVMALPFVDMAFSVLNTDAFAGRNIMLIVSDLKEIAEGAPEGDAAVPYLVGAFIDKGYIKPDTLDRIMVIMNTVAAIKRGPSDLD